MNATHPLRRMRRRNAVALTATAGAIAALTLVAVTDPDSSAGHQRPRRIAATASVQPIGSHACPSGAAASRSREALLGAERRFRVEAQGAVIQHDLRQVAADPGLLEALRAHDLARALAEAERVVLNHDAGGVFVNHVVRLRVLSGSRVLVDANPTSFDVAGASLTLRAPGGAALGRLQITIQDVLGFDKLVHKLVHTDLLVRGAAGQVQTTLPAAARVALPSSGCVRVAGRTLVVGSFSRPGFTGETLRIFVLTPA